MLGGHRSQKRDSGIQTGPHEEQSVLLSVAHLRSPLRDEHLCSLGQVGF